MDVFSAMVATVSHNLLGIFLFIGWGFSADVIYEDYSASDN